MVPHRLVRTAGESLAHLRPLGAKLSPGLLQNFILLGGPQCVNNRGIQSSVPLGAALLGRPTGQLLHDLPPVLAVSLNQLDQLIVLLLGPHSHLAVGVQC